MAPPHKPVDEAMLEKLAAVGLIIPEMASILGVSHDTLERNYLDVIELGKQKRNASVRRKQFEMAMAGNITMLIFLGKQYLGQRDIIDNFHSGPDGGAIPISIELDV